ncbi:ABC transporter ATP-binding protein [Cryomorphaceae bacterium]|nr:ABC transporter ATP-binding protein [Cryomorphaceae bacterium]
MIEMKGLSKVFRMFDVETTAVDHLDLEIESGDFLAIMGPSGCGKSSLLNMLGLIDRPSAGKLYIDGQDVSALDDKTAANWRKHRIGFVFQSFNLIDELNVYENIELPLIYTKRSSQEKQELVEELLETMRLLHRKHHFPYQLSGGQKQRVAMARAMVNQPNILLADEPTGNLDSQAGEEILELLTELNSHGTTVILVTHSDRDASYAKRIIRMRDGAIAQEVW